MFRLKAEALRGYTAECGGALHARAYGAEMVIAEDAGVMAVVKVNLHRIVAHLAGGLRADFRFEHGKSGRRHQCRRFRGVPGVMFLLALLIAHGARALFA